jgi:hypothetical protein
LRANFQVIANASPEAGKVSLTVINGVTPQNLSLAAAAAIAVCTSTKHCLPWRNTDSHPAGSGIVDVRPWAVQAKPKRAKLCQLDFSVAMEDT